MATAPVHRISIHAAAETEPPATPALGANFAANTLQGSGWVTIGSVDRGDDGDIDSAAVGVTPIHEGVTVRPPGSLSNQRYVTRHAGVDEVTFAAYDATQDVFELDSNVATVGPESQRSATQTNRALLVEVDGIRYDWYPNVVLHVVGEPGGFGPGDDAVSKYEFRAKIIGTDDVPSGQLKVHYEGGT